MVGLGRRGAGQGRGAGAGWCSQGAAGHDGRRVGAGRGARVDAVVGAEGVSGDVEQPDGVGGGGDGKVEQGRRAAMVTSTRRSMGRRGRSGGFGQKLLSVVYISRALVPVRGTNRD